MLVKKIAQKHLFSTKEHLNSILGIMLTTSEVIDAF